MRKYKVIYNILTTFVLQVIILLSGFLVQKLIIQAFGSDVNGLVVSITQFLGYITLLESGIGPVIKAALYKPIVNKNRDEILGILKSSDSFFKKLSYIFLVYIVFLCFIYPFIVLENFDFFFTFSLIIIISVSTFFEYYLGMTYKLYLQSIQKNYVISYIQIITYILNTLAVILLIKLHFSIQVIKLATAFIFVLRPIMQSVYVKKKYNIDIKKWNKKIPIKQKWEGLSQHIAATIHRNTDVVILTFLTSTSVISVYSVYLLIINGIRNLTKSLVSGVDAFFGNMLAIGNKKVLNKKIKIYEVVYFSLITVIFTSTFLLCLPFIKVYTNGIKDADYYKPFFAFLLILSEFIWTIRQPYNELIKAGGYFKETRVGAWLEAGVNIILSLFFTIKYGMIGVAIGTLISMFIRFFEFIYFASVHILDRKLRVMGKYIFVIFLEVSLCLFIVGMIPFPDPLNYFDWFVQATITLLAVTLIVLFIDLVFYRAEIKTIIDMFRKEKKV